MTQAFVIGRRRKGRAIEARVRETASALEAQGWYVESEVVGRKRDLTERVAGAARSGCDVIVIVGGDGAVLRAVPALAGTDVALGIIPTGTGNLLAGNLGIPRDPLAAARMIVSGRRRRIDLGRVRVGGTTHDFSVACGVGFDAQVMDRTSPGLKRRFGKLAYLAGAVAEGRGIANARHEITLDGVRTELVAAQVFVANFGRMLAGVAPRRPVRPDDGLLDVIVVRASGPLDGLVAGWNALRQRNLGESPGGRVFRAEAREIRIETTPPRLVEVDGTVVGRTPIEVEVLPSALTVIVPSTRGEARR